ncbi:hypothetical protein CRYUN_Cryun14cG0101700 [Craigia yunnanensis]
MAFAKRTVGFFLMRAFFGVSLGAVHKVGDPTGWTSIGKIDYSKWASTQSFHVGDSLRKLSHRSSSVSLFLPSWLYGFRFWHFSPQEKKKVVPVFLDIYILSVNKLHRVRDFLMPCTPGSHLA